MRRKIAEYRTSNDKRIASKAPFVDCLIAETKLAQSDQRQLRIS